jgi:hypothetical protein
MQQQHIIMYRTLPDVALDEIVLIERDGRFVSGLTLRPTCANDTVEPTSTSAETRLTRVT